MAMSWNRDSSSDLFQEPYGGECVQCSWFASPEHPVLLYVCNEIVYGTGSISSGPTSSGLIRLHLQYEQTPVKTIDVPPGDTTTYSIIGITNIQLIALGPANGEFLFRPIFSVL